MTENSSFTAGSIKSFAATWRHWKSRDSGWWLSFVSLPPHSGRRRKSKSTPTKKEEKLLRQLKQIANLMQEGRVEGASPEMEAEEVPYSPDWEGILPLPFYNPSVTNFVFFPTKSSFYTFFCHPSGFSAKILLRLLRAANLFWWSHFLRHSKNVNF